MFFCIIWILNIYDFDVNELSYLVFGLLVNFFLGIVKDVLLEIFLLLF